MSSSIPAIKSNYILIIELQTPKTFFFKPLKKEIILPPGLYIYIGSAHGPGGVRARLLRHLSKNKKIKWHIDLLTVERDVEVKGSLILRKDNRKECDLVIDLLKSNYFEIPVKKFGSTDTKCVTHLLRYKGRDLNSLENILKKMFHGFLFLKF